MNKMLFIQCALLFILAVSAPISAQTPYHPTVGQAHPDFVFPAVDDRRPVALSDYRGKKVLLIHFASW